MRGAASALRRASFWYPAAINKAIGWNVAASLSTAQGHDDHRHQDRRKERIEEARGADGGGSTFE